MKLRNFQKPNWLGMDKKQLLTAQIDSSSKCLPQTVKKSQNLAHKKAS